MFDPTTLVGFHTWLSLIGIVTGIPVVAGLVRGHDAPAWVVPFLATAVATDLTGYFFPVTAVLPSHIVGAVSLVALAGAVVGRYLFHFEGFWRWVYAAGSVGGLYFLIFVGVAQAFAKVPFLNALGPTPADPAFGIAQGMVLVIFAYLTWKAVKRFRPA